MSEIPEPARAFKTEDVLALIGAAKRHLATNPVFRSKPIGAPHSAARLEQEDRIATEDALREALHAIGSK